MRTICYYPELVQRTGSINAALMMAQLEFWFKMTGSKPFYKFLEPCGHELYKKGDSWSEELGMTSSEIRSAFKRIGTIYKSKRAFKESQDVFKGKPYASYYDRIRKTTYYLRNTEKAQQMMPEDTLLGICHEITNISKEAGISKQTNSQITSIGNALETTYVNQASRDRDSSTTWQRSERDGDSSAIWERGEQAGDGSTTWQDVEQDRDDFDIRKEQICVNEKNQDGLDIEDYIDDNIQDKQIRQYKESYSLIPYTEIVELYNNHLGQLLGYVADLTQQEKESIKMLWLKFNIKLESFKKGFMKVAVSRFLCGKVEGKKWKASLRWLITGKHFSKVLAGAYDDFVTPIVSASRHTGLDKVKQFNQMESHNWDFDEIERLERLYIDRKLGVLLS